MVNCLIESIEPLNVLCTCVLQFPICQDAKADITVDLNYLDPKVHIDLSIKPWKMLWWMKIERVTKLYYFQGYLPT